MKISIQEVFNLMCEFKTYHELDMMVTLKYGVDFFIYSKKLQKYLDFVLMNMNYIGCGLSDKVVKPYV